MVKYEPEPPGLTARGSGFSFSAPPEEEGGPGAGGPEAAP